jgi:hypothetical protein
MNRKNFLDLENRAEYNSYGKLKPLDESIVIYLRDHDLPY